uniref:S-acyltransferase n=1 Tax=Kalanchoe fedtschenkoi TaxID=63787 RepID=A0A7N0UTX5_KALFE
MGFGTTRRNGWQRPLHPLQIVGMAVFSFFVVAFYSFLGLFLGNKIAEITVTSIFSISAVAVMFLFMRCTATDPSDRTSCKKKKKKGKGVLKLNYGYIIGQIVVRFVKRIERRILKTFIRRNYLDPWKTSLQMEPLLPFPLVSLEDAVPTDPKDLDISFCSLCDLQVKKRSKHCRTCNRCVEGFDHHCRWLNNCIGKRNYTTFILLMVFLMLMFIVEGGTALAIFIRCFADKKGIEQELERKLYMKFPSGVLAAISAMLILMSSYSSAALGQLFFFHLVLIRKGMKTYDYILAMREENQSHEIDPFDDSDSSSDESADFVTPEKSSCLSRVSCRQNQSPKRLSIRIDKPFEPADSTKKPGFHATINPWKLIKVNSEKALLAAERARQRLMTQKPLTDHNTLKPLPEETKSGPLLNLPKNLSKENLTKSVPEFRTSDFKPSSASPGWRASPRRRFSGSSTSTPFGGPAAPSPKRKYKSSFDLKLTEVSRELETHISKQVLCSAFKKDAIEASPR